MDISVDRKRCQGIGLCEMNSPGVFRVGGDGYAELVDGAGWASSDVDDVLTAIDSCPTQALARKPPRIALNRRTNT